MATIKATEDGRISSGHGGAAAGSSCLISMMPEHASLVMFK
jgi:hypothetical protein